MPESQFSPIAGAADLWDGEMESYQLDGAEILLIKLDGEYHAYDGRCPHQDTPLIEGRLDGTSLICGAHEWEFDARTGAGINPCTVCLRRYEVRVADGQVMVSRPAPASTAPASTATRKVQ